MGSDYNRANETLDALDEGKPKKLKKSRAAKLKEIKNRLNPLDNKTDIDGVKVKWKVSPHYKKDKFKMRVEVSKKFDDVELYARVNGKMFRIMEEGLSYDINKDIFKAEIGADLRF